MVERVYDRAIPSREGSVIRFDKAAFTYLVRWDDTGKSEWVDIDQLGRIPENGAG